MVVAPSAIGSMGVRMVSFSDSPPPGGACDGLMAGGGPAFVRGVGPVGGHRAIAACDRAVPVLHSTHRASDQHLAPVLGTPGTDQPALRPPPLARVPLPGVFAASHGARVLGGRGRGDWFPRRRGWNEGTHRHRENRRSGTRTRRRHGVHLSSCRTQTTGHLLSEQRFFLTLRGPRAARASPPVTALPIPPFRTAVPLYRCISWTSRVLAN